MQVADIAAHGGTSGVGVGNVGGDALGLGVDDGEADGDGDGVSVGLGWTTAAGADPHADTTTAVANPSSPVLSLTGHSNEKDWPEVTGRPLVNTGAQG